MDIESLALSKRFAKGLALGGYTSVTAQANVVHFKMHDGTDVNVTLPIPKDGIGIKDVKLVDGELICTMTNDTEINAGTFPQGELSEDLIVSNPVGSATLGKKYLKNTSFETLLRDVLIKEEIPTLTFSLTPNKTLYDKVTETLNEVTIKTLVGKKTYNVSNIKYYVDDVLVNTITEEVSDGGTFNYTYAYSPSKNTDTTIKVVVTDIKGLYTTKTTTIKFVGKSYYGYVDSEIGEPTEAQIKALQNRILKDTKSLTYKNISFDYNKVVYAYPKSFGELSIIKDEINNINYTNSFSRTIVRIDNIDYYVYTQTDASQSVNNELKFA